MHAAAGAFNRVTLRFGTVDRPLLKPIMDPGSKDYAALVHAWLTAMHAGPPRLDNLLRSRCLLYISR